MQELMTRPLLCRGLTWIPHFTNPAFLTRLFKLVSDVLLLVLSFSGLRSIARSGCWPSGFRFTPRASARAQIIYICPLLSFLYLF